MKLFGRRSGAQGGTAGNRRVPRGVGAHPARRRGVRRTEDRGDRRLDVVGGPRRRVHPAPRRLTRGGTRVRAATHALPIYDATVVGYPQRMRDYSRRQVILQQRAERKALGDG